MRFDLKQLLNRDKKFRKFIRLGNLRSGAKAEEIRAAGIWGTLGWGDDSLFAPKNQLEFSETFNTNFHGATAEFVEELSAALPDEDQSNLTIKERYINFDLADLQMNKLWFRKHHRNLRLSVFLEKDEHALAYYQFAEPKDYSRPENSEFDDPDAFLEFIPGQLDSVKKQINFFFEPLPKRKIRIRLFSGKRGFEETDEPLNTSFIVKVITFKKKDGSDAQFYEKSLEKLALQAGQNAIYKAFGEKRYGLYKFNPYANVTDDETFEEKHQNFGGKMELIQTEQAATEINTSAKTLLLIHGTFVNTYSTFKDLFLKHNGSSFLQDLMTKHGYEQILAFDHPTASSGVLENVEYLLTKLMPGVSFGDNAIDAIACSRGGMVAEALASHKLAKGKIHLRHVVLFSPANGVGYLQTADNIATWLSVYRRISPRKTGKIVASMLTAGVTFIKEMPGLKDMHPNSPTLKKILNAEQNNPNTTFKNVVSDWHISLNESRFRRVLGWLDVKIKSHLGEEHDWVVGCINQRMYPKFARQDKEATINSIHCKYLEKNYSKRNGSFVDTQKIILDFLKK